MKKTDRKTLLSRVKRVVIKIGSSVLTNEHGELSEGVFDEIAGEISRIKSRGIEPIIVSSGAIAAGMKKLNLGVKPRDISMKQAIAACGQSALMWYYEKAFSAFGEKVAQILLTHDVLSVRKRFLNARKTLFTLLRIEEIAGETLGRTTTGGMRTKIEASKTAAAFGVPTIIANGKKPTKLSEIFSGKDIGTLFLPAKEKLKGRKHWIAFTLKPSGEIRIDDGAKRAISSSGKSLLPAGIKDVSGEFEVGELVRCIDEGGIEVARGLSSYSSDEIRKIAGAKTSEIEKILGYRYSDEVIHRDDLVVVSKK